MGRLIDLVGQRFGRLTVDARSDRRDRRGGVFWRCSCDCGESIVLLGQSLRRGATTSCGCSRMSRKDWELSIERLRDVLSYDAATGEFARRAAAGAMAGIKVGSRHCAGYLSIGVDGRTYLAHRLAWFYVHGAWPSVIDHIDGDRLNNRISNLREVTLAQNNQNRRRGTNASGLLGVSWDPENKRWRARIKVNGKQKFIGRYATAEQAHEAYVATKREVHTHGAL